MSSKARLVALVLLSSLVLGCSVEDAIPWATETEGHVPTPPAYDLSGRWRYYTTPYGGSEEDNGVMKITQTGSSLSGTTASGATITGSISGDHVEFWVNDSLNCATATTADHIEGIWIDQGGFSGSMRAERLKGRRNGAGISR